MRKATIDRNTNETKIRGALTLEGKGRAQISTGIRFLDHMLELFARHGGFNLKVRATGDLDIWVRPTPANASRVITALERFGALMPSLLSEKDRRRDCYVSEDRRGQEMSYPFPTLSIGAVEVPANAITTHLEVSGAATAAPRAAPPPRGYRRSRPSAPGAAAPGMRR